MGSGIAKRSKRGQAKHKAMEAVKEIQRGKQGKDTNYQLAETGSRKERRRYAKATRKYDKKHGEGAADRNLRAALERDPDPLASKFVRG